MDAITAAVRGARDEALRDLLSRTVKAADELTVILQDDKALLSAEHHRVRGKIEGVNLVRSYIEEMLRGDSMPTCQKHRKGMNCLRPDGHVEHEGTRHIDHYGNEWEDRVDMGTCANCGEEIVGHEDGLWLHVGDETFDHLARPEPICVECGKPIVKADVEGVLWVHDDDKIHHHPARPNRAP